jgi:hypothetical protein
MVGINSIVGMSIVGPLALVELFVLFGRLGLFVLSGLADQVRDDVGPAAEPDRPGGQLAERREAHLEFDDAAAAWRRRAGRVAGWPAPGDASHCFFIHYIHAGEQREGRQAIGAGATSGTFGERSWIAAYAWGLGRRTSGDLLPYVTCVG